MKTLGEAFVSEKVALSLVASRRSASRWERCITENAWTWSGKRNDYVKVRTIAGTVGWVESRQLMEPALWQRKHQASWSKREECLCRRAGAPRSPPICECSLGGRSPRLYKFGRNVPVEIVAARWARLGTSRG